MTDKKEDVKEKNSPIHEKEEVKKLRQEGTKVDQKELIKQLATREIIERDYREDIIEVVFDTSPSNKRKIRAHKPNHDQMMEIMELIAISNEMQKGTVDMGLWKEVKSSYSRLPLLAAELSVDKKLDAEFWKKNLSTFGLQLFLLELITEANQSTGIPQDKMESFR